MSDLPRSDVPEGEEPKEAPASKPDDDAASRLFTLARPSELVPAEFRNVRFGPALGGYNRGQVDSYVERVNRLIAELEISRSPEKAVKLALERVGEQAAGILQHAREAAEELTDAAVAESEHATRRARVEADELLERAQNESSELLAGAEEESRAIVERAAAESAELVARSQERLETIRAQIDDARREHEHILEQLRATAAALDSFAARAQGAGESDAPAPAGPPAGAADEDAGEPPTEVIRADEPGDEDTSGPEGAAADGPPRRRITRSRPRTTWRETAGPTRAARD